MWSAAWPRYPGLIDLLGTEAELYRVTSTLCGTAPGYIYSEFMYLELLTRCHALRRALFLRDVNKRVVKSSDQLMRGVVSGCHTALASSPLI